MEVLVYVGGHTGQHATVHGANVPWCPLVTLDDQGGQCNSHYVAGVRRVLVYVGGHTGQPAAVQGANVPWCPLVPSNQSQYELFSARQHEGHTAAQGHQSPCTSQQTLLPIQW